MSRFSRTRARRNAAGFVALPRVLTPLNAALRFAALGLLSSLMITSAIAQTAHSLPEVNVIQQQEQPTLPPKAKASPAPTKIPIAAKPRQPPAVSQPVAAAKPRAPNNNEESGTDPTTPTSDGGTTSGVVTTSNPADRAGSLTVPSTAEARAEIARTPGAVTIVPDGVYKTSTPATTIKDALEYVPGIFVQPKWGEDTRLSIRGSGLSRNFHGRGVTLLMDGVIPISQASGNSDFQEIDPTAYRYIEVYKGANALRFGASSLGGAINFVMPTGYDADQFGARVDVGSFGFRKAAVNSGGVYGAADYFISLTAQEQDGYRDHSEGESVRAAMNVGYRLTPDIETRFYLNANDINQRIPGAVTRSEALTNPQGAFVRPGSPVTFSGQGNDNVDRDYRRNIDSTRVANRTTMRVSPGTVVELGGFYFNRHLDHPIFAVVDQRSDEYGGFGRIVDEGMIGDFKNRFVAGVSQHNGDEHAKLLRNNLGLRGAVFSNTNQSSDTTTLYAENSFFVRPDLALVASLQYAAVQRRLDDRFLADGDQSGTADFDLVSPKLGFVWDATPYAQMFGNISRSAEAPTFGEITVTSITTTSLKPQEATTYEVGTRGATSSVTWDIAVYHAAIENEFQCLSTGALGTCTQVNIDASIHQGAELGLGVKLMSGILKPANHGASDALWLNAAYTFSDFRFDDDRGFGNNDLPGAPRHFLRAELLYKHSSGLYGGPNVEWVPDGYFVDSANTFATEAYALLGAKLGFDDGGAVTSYIEGRNLTDEAYISSASIATRANAQSLLFEPGNGRAIYGGLQYRW